jgi:prepilin-type N-terminal cleavage/methylation domain-containing protein
MNPSFSFSEKKGFTLMESVIAIGVVAILITTFLAIFGPATQGIRRAISAQDADRLAVALESELGILRESENTNDVNSAFDKAYDWLEKSSQAETGRIFLYNFKGDPTKKGADGIMAPIDSKDTKPSSGKKYIVTPAVRFVENKITPEMIAELKVASGPVFYVKTTQLVYEDGAMVLSDEPGLKPPHQDGEPLPGGGDGADAYPEAVIAFTADFHLMKSSSPDYLENLDFIKLGRPLFSRNMAVRR